MLKDDIIEKYKNYLLLERSLSRNSIDAYIDDVLKLLRFLEDEKMKLRDIKLDDLQQFVAQLYDLGINARRWQV